MKRKFKFNYKPNFKPNFKSLSYLIVGIVMGILISAPLSLANNPIKLLVNGQEVQCLVSPQNVNGYVMVSIRDIATALGFEIGWDSEQNAVVVTSIKVETTKPVAPNVNVNPTQDVVKDNNKSATSVTETIITPEADNPKPPVTSNNNNNNSNNKKQITKTTFQGMEAVIKDGITYVRFANYIAKIQSENPENSCTFDQQTKFTTITYNKETIEIPFTEENAQIIDGGHYINIKFCK